MKQDLQRHILYKMIPVRHPSELCQVYLYCEWLYHRTTQLKMTSRRTNTCRPGNQVRDLVPVTCPACFEVFEVAAPPLAEIPCEVDYDCEVCCRPMVIAFSTDADNRPEASARGLDDA